jgi:hypothetical protein
LSAQEDEPDDRRVGRADPPLSSPSLPLLPPMSATSSQTTMQGQSLGQHSSNEDSNRDDLTHPTTSSAGINSNGKRPYQLLGHDKENLEHPLLPVPVPNKKARGGGRTMAGRGGHHKK